MTKIVPILRAVTLWICALVGIAYIGLFAGKPMSSERAALAAAAEAPPAEDVIVFQNGLAPGWQDWSWAERSIPAPDHKFGGQATIRMVPGGWKGLFLHHDPFATNGYKALVFYISGGATGGQKLAICTVDGANKFGQKVDLTIGLGAHVIPAGKFAICVIPLEKLGAVNTNISGICVQDNSGAAQSPIYLADIRFSTGRKPAARGGGGGPADNGIALSVDAVHPLGSISPYVYGMAQPGLDHLKQLRLKLWRWGGNPNTRYNWVRGNCWSAARDWGFRNGNYNHKSEADRQPSGVADQSIALGKNYGCDALITIPTMGWVARDDDNKTASVGVPSQSGPPVRRGSDAIAGYDPAANRQRVSVPSLSRKGASFSDPPDTTGDVVYQDEWVYHLTRKFGKANAGGVRFYAMDNEPDLWDVTHTDMHPVRPDYDEVLSRFLEYANAVKDVDPAAQITGPVSWGWTGYFFSSRDRGDDNYRTHADRLAHGDMPFLPWFLQQVAAHDAKTKRRSLDVLDVHFYPQADGVYNGGRSDPQANALRLRSTRALWDPNYSDESWIGTPVQLIPRLRQWITKYYPGTKIGLTEWNWGPDNTLNGGLAIAEILGVLGREQVELACYWAVPGVGTPGFYAYKIFRNADDAGHGFGDIAVPAVSSDPNRISCFGSIDAKTGRPVLMIINKMPQQDAQATLTLTTSKPVSGADVYRYSGTDLKNIKHLADIAIIGNRVKVKLPAYSITLLRCR